MTDKPSRKFYSPTPRSGPGKEQEPTTLPPPFDIEAFAREETGPGAASALQPAPPGPKSRPKLGGPERDGPPSASSLLGAIHASMVPDSPRGSDDDRIAAMRECFSWGDYAGALTMADLILAAQPDNLLTREFRTNCRTALEDVYTFRLGPLNRIAVLVKPFAPSGNRTIEQRTGLLLSLIDGSSPLETIVSVCGLPRLDALRILHDLVQSGTVRLV